MGKITENDLALFIVQKAEGGDFESALKILEEFCISVDIEQPVNAEYLKYLARCFEKILDNHKNEVRRPGEKKDVLRVKESLNLKGFHRSASSKTRDAKLELAIGVQRAINFGSNVSDAVKKVAYKKKVSEAQVRAARQEFKEFSMIAAEKPEK